jgi:hypothetical protein
MPKGGIDTFALVIDYLDEAWTPRHVIINLFEVYETISGSAIILMFQSFLEKIGLIH